MVPQMNGGTNIERHRVLPARAQERKSNWTADRVDHEALTMAVNVAMATVITANTANTFAKPLRPS
jgi:hypothetical protein